MVVAQCDGAAFGWSGGLGPGTVIMSSGETSVVTNVIQHPQYMVMCACPIRGMVEAGVDVVPGTFTTHEIQLTGAWMARSQKERGQGCW